MIIKNAKIWTEQGFVTGDLILRGERISDISRKDESLAAGTDSLPDNLPEKEARAEIDCPLEAGMLSDAGFFDETEEILDAGGLLAIPGLVDIHFHGAMGRDFCDADEESLRIIAKYEAEQGILAICPATMTLPEEMLLPVMRTAAAHRNGEGADLVGINMEGPFISPGKVGAQNPVYVTGADGPMFDRLQEACGHLIRLVDLAPEEAGSMDFIRDYHDRVRISVAHTCADYETAEAAFAAGARHMTHLFNAMPGIGHREPGPIIAGLEAGATAEIIADGIHVHPAMVRMAFQSFGKDRMILISDSLEATGLKDGEYSLGGQSITLKGGKVVLTEHPETIAGSACNLYQCMKKAILEMGIPAAAAIQAAAANPAKAIGIDRDYGSLTPGHYANVILADEDLQIRRIIQKGKVLTFENTHSMIIGQGKACTKQKSC